MHYVWQHRLVLQADMVTTDGERVEIVDPGQLNHDAGPDFFNAKVRIGERMWCGNVEMHLRASDWHRHGHDDDPAYSSVILHVVGAEDCRITVANGRTLPQMVMRCAPDFHNRYVNMVDSPTDRLACYNELKEAPRIYVTDCITAMAFERLYEKSDRITALVKRLDGNWTEAFYVTLARALGFGLNGQAFEQLALGVPLRTLLKHRDDPGAVEGLLFGLAGLLPDTAEKEGEEDTYVQIMRREYTFLRHKFNLTPPDGVVWRMSRTRPHNFPHRRIAALAAMVTEGFTIASRACSVSTLDEARGLFDITLPYYWVRRYHFGAPSGSAPSRAFSKQSIDILVINAIVPLLHAYGTFFGDERLQSLAVSLLEQIPAEQNTITRLFEGAGIHCADAFTSQAVIHLRRNYCETRKCLYCRLGHQFLCHKAKYTPA